VQVPHGQDYLILPAVSLGLFGFLKDEDEVSEKS